MLLPLNVWDNIIQNHEISKKTAIWIKLPTDQIKK